MRINSFTQPLGGRTSGQSRPRADDSGPGRAVAEPPTAADTTDDDALGQGVKRGSQVRPGLSLLHVPAGLAVLTLSAPVLAVILVTVGLSHEMSFLVMASWSLAQFLLVLGRARRLLVPSVDERGTDAIANIRLGDDAIELDAHRAKDRLHEVRATVAGIGLTYRLLSDEHVRLSGADRTRLEHLYDREITRLERLLRDDEPSASENVDVQAAVDPVVESLRLRGHRVTWEGTEAIAIGRGDDITEIVHVLLENSARHAPAADISVRVENSPTHLLLRVTDTGPGVPSALLPRLFERGIRGPESPGEGIGLNIARRLAREMGGDIVLDLDSQKSGAAFTVALRPRAEPAPYLVG